MDILSNQSSKEAALRAYRIIRSDDSYHLEYGSESTVDDRKAVCAFTLNQTPPENPREEFDQLLHAAQHGSSLLKGVVVRWQYNQVQLDTYLADPWSTYTELNAEMAN